MKRKVDIERNFTRAFFYRHIANIELCRSSAILVLVKVAATFRWSSRLEAQDFQRLSEVQRPENQPFLLYFGLQQVFKVVPQDGLRHGGCVQYDRKRNYRKGKGRSVCACKKKATERLFRERNLLLSCWHFADTEITSINQCCQLFIFSSILIPLKRNFGVIDMMSFGHLMGLKLLNLCQLNSLKGAIISKSTVLDMKVGTFWEFYHSCFSIWK